MHSFFFRNNGIVLDRSVRSRERTIVPQERRPAYSQSMILKTEIESSQIRDLWSLKQRSMALKTEIHGPQNKDYVWTFKQRIMAPKIKIIQGP